MCDDTMVTLKTTPDLNRVDRITATAAAPEGGATIVVKLDGASTTLMIPGGQTSGTTVLAAPKATKPTTVKISGTYDGATKIAWLSIAP